MTAQNEYTKNPVSNAGAPGCSEKSASQQRLLELLS